MASKRIDPHWAVESDVVIFAGLGYAKYFEFAPTTKVPLGCGALVMFLVARRGMITFGAKTGRSTKDNFGRYGRGEILNVLFFPFPCFPQLLAAIKAQGDKPKIIKLYGTIDPTTADNGGPYKNAADQKARLQIKLTSNTTLIGMGSDTKLVNAGLILNGIQKVIIRNLNIVNPCDINPLWDPEDGSAGNWNNNHFLHISERAPRVRFGKVHVFNNYFEGSRSHKVYPHKYSVGVGYKAKIIMQNNAFDIAGASSCADIANNPGSASKSGAITDTGSLLNGAALNLAGKCSFSSSVGWTPPYTANPAAASSVRQSVLNNAGTGKISVN